MYLIRENISGTTMAAPQKHNTAIPTLPTILDDVRVSNALIFCRRCDDSSVLLMVKADLIFSFIVSMSWLTLSTFRNSHLHGPQEGFEVGIVVVDGTSCVFSECKYEDSIAVDSVGDSVEVCSVVDSALVGSVRDVGSVEDSVAVGSDGDSVAVGSDGDSVAVGSVEDSVAVGSDGVSVAFDSDGNSVTVDSVEDTVAVGSVGNSVAVDSVEDTVAVGSD